MAANNPNCDVTLLRRYLTGELLATEEANVVGHLDNCPHCQQDIESLAAGAAEWNDVRRLFTPDAFQPLAVSRPLIAGSAVSAGETSATDLAACSSSESRLDFLAPTDDPEMLGRLGPYEIKGLVGQGGMGLVLKAYDRALQRTVAIKVLSPHLATNPTARRRFAREAQAAAAVAHEHVIAIHAVAEAGGLPYLVMPYMPGQSLQQRLDEAGPLAPVEVLRISSQIAAGLTAAHAQGLVHRDIKPANILLEQGIERVAITDFGLARAIDDASLTRTGVLAGTPAYMSPEQARGEAVDHRADLFSLGSVMYAMCAGRPPFRAESTIAVLKRICEEEAVHLSQLTADVPPWLVRVIARLHAKVPAERFATAAEVAELLQRCLAHLQNPTASPLPDELEESARAGNRLSLRKPMLLIAGSTAAVCIAAALLWGPLSNLTLLNQTKENDPLKSAARETQAAGELEIEDATQQTAGASVADGRSTVPSVRPLVTNSDYQWLEQSFKQAHIDDPEKLYEWSLRLLQTELETASSGQTSAAARRHRQRMQRLEKLAAERGDFSDALHKAAVKFYCLEAELMLTQEP